jgi:hypothetical protein
MLKSIGLDSIRIDGGTQSRESIDPDLVNEYRQALEDGAKLPPLIVFHDGSDYWLADGFHRYFAAKRKGSTQLQCEVHNGEQRDAILFAVGSNAMHGQRRTNADKRHCVEMVLADEEWAKKSDRWIAEKCGVGPDLVADVRGSPIGNRQVREGRDGKTYDTSNIGRGKKKQEAPDEAPVEAPPQTEPAESEAEDVKEEANSGGRMRSPSVKLKAELKEKMRMSLSFAEAFRRFHYEMEQARRTHYIDTSFQAARARVQDLEATIRR